MAKDTRVDTRIKTEDLEVLEKAVNIIKKDPNKKVSKYYGVSSFLLESGLNRAKRLIAQKPK